jgi:hypothetical protein
MQRKIFTSVFLGWVGLAAASSPEEITKEGQTVTVINQFKHTITIAAYKPEDFPSSLRQRRSSQASQDSFLKGLSIPAYVEEKQADFSKHLGGEPLFWGDSQKLKGPCTLYLQYGKEHQRLCLVPEGIQTVVIQPKRFYFLHKKGTPFTCVLKP